MQGEQTQQVQQMADDYPEVTEAMRFAGMRAWDESMKAGQRNWFFVLAKVFVAMEQARETRDAG